MLGQHKIVVDEWAEVFDILKPYADETFWQFLDVDFDPQKFYLIGRVQLKENYLLIRDLAQQYPGRIIFCNPAEGSQTVLLQLTRLRITDMVRSGQIGLMTSGDLEPGYDALSVDCYFTNIVEYLENLSAHQHSDRVRCTDKPYDFLFLNGRLRPHRKYMIDSMRERGLLERALWTNLQNRVDLAWTSELKTAETEPIRTLPAQYEIERAVPNLDKVQNYSFAKHFLFNNSWGDSVINPEPYVDTCFTVVTETIFDYPYSFRTEKIWKPMIMLHPFVVASNAGYYRDLHKIGFRTFGHLIDESFDNIPNTKDRADRVVDVIADIIRNGAEDFLHASTDVCKYNYQHLQQYNREQREQLPTMFEQYLNERQGI
jgi:hypothetical protein